MTCASVNDNIKQEIEMATDPIGHVEEELRMVFLVVLTKQNFVLICAHYSRNFFTKIPQGK